MNGKFYEYTGDGEVGDVIPGVGIISKDPIQARDEKHQQAIEDSGVFKKVAAAKAPKTDTTEGGK